MAIELTTPGGKAHHPVLRHKVIGETFTGMLIGNPVQRDQLDKDGAPKLKDNGRPRQELVITLMTVASTMTCGSKDDNHVPQPGEIVRDILKGKAYGTWIDAEKAVGGIQVGDVYSINTTNGQAYDQNGQAYGPVLSTQAEVEAQLLNGSTVGRYGDLTLRRATTEEQPQVAAAEAAYHANQTVIALEGAAPAVDTSAAFGAPPAAPSVAGAAPYQAPPAPAAAPAPVWPAA